MKKQWYIALPAICGLSFLVWLSSCARLAYDDYLFAACFKGHSFFDAIKILSNTHTFRWTTFLLQDLVFGIVPGQYFPVSILVFFLAFYILWIYQLYRLLQITVQRYLSMAMDQWLSLSLAALFITGLYFATSQVVEGFTFSGAVCDRLVPMLFVTIALNILLRPNRGWKTYLKLGLIALLIAGTAENSTATLLIAIVLFVIWKKLVMKDNLPSALIFFAVELLIFFGMELLSPGSDARYKAEKVYRFTCGPDNSYCADSLPLFLGRFFQWRQILALPILFLFFIAANQLPDATRTGLRALSKRILFFLLILFVPVALFHGVAIQWVFDCYGPMRTWFPLNVLIVSMGIFTSIYMGCWSWRQAPGVNWVATVLSVGVIVVYFGKHYGPTSNYKNAYDDRVTYALGANRADSVLTIEPLPPADLVVEGDIMQDENDDVNRDFADTYRLPFKVRKKK